jgi:transmembrane sensor
VTPRRDAREVRLEGRAHFSVAPDPARPFRVRTRAGDVEVLGTRFDLSTREEDLQLIVVEGRVSLSAAGAAIEVGGGEISGIADGALIPPRRVMNPDSALQWVGTFLVFRSTPLADAAREVERVYGVSIRIPDPSIAARTVTATFADQDAAQVARVLCTIVGARCVTEADGTILITR